MRNRIIKVGVLAAVFVLALVVSSLLINRGTDDKIVNMGSPSLPRISFFVGDTEVNPLPGYTRDMDITAMRDTIIPLGTDGSLRIRIGDSGDTVDSIRYEVYSLDGEDRYIEGKADLPEENGQAVLDIGNILSPENREAVLKISLSMGEETAGYYTRIALPEDITTAECLAYAQSFHTDALTKQNTEEMDSHLEPGEATDNTTYQTVNIHSNINHVQWGDLAPEVVGDVEWSIKESNTVYTSILANYQVSCRDEDGQAALYNVREFFRVRSLKGTIYLLDYNRDMERVFRGNTDEFSENGILFGIASDDIQYTANKDETIVAFVQERNLWLYNGESGELTQVFSFADQEGRDMRSRNDQHAVRIISMEDNGDLSFMVYGYMNCGTHEGEVGVGVYNFSADSNVIEEQAYIPSTKSYAIAADELGKMVYYNHSESLLYVLASGTLYQIDLDKEEQTVLAEELTEEQYAVSDDGHQVAYQTQNDSGASRLVVMDLRSGSSQNVDAEGGESLRPLGFIHGDFIFGRYDPDDSGVTVAGEEICPMYEIEIRNEAGETEAEYSFADQGIYTTDILIQDNQITLDRVSGGGGQYQAAAQEYITNNQERSDSTITLGTYYTDQNETQTMLSFADGLPDVEPEYIRPGQIVSGEPLTVTISGGSEKEEFYVYGMGELLDIYDRAGYAVQRASEISAVVISSEQAYVWESGNRDLAYSTDAAAFQKNGGESSMEACERYMEQYNAHQIDLTGCTLDQMLYVINRGCPMIAMTGADHAVLLTGYTTTDITYIDPDDGQVYTVGQGDMKAATEAAGNVFIGYIK